MAKIIGRRKEIEELNTLYDSGKPEFVAVYGRRRIGKTFLVDNVMRGRITFRHAGLSPVDEGNGRNGLKEQLRHFFFSLKSQGADVKDEPKSWMEAFFQLEQFLLKIDKGERQVVFIDELPWLDTPRSGFITAFEGFWNGWACHRDNLMLVVCGSANSWMLNNLVNNHGGLYGRVTYEIRLSPFTLGECEDFLKNNGVRMSRYDIAQSYMIMGGVPYYLGYIRKGLSLAQNVDELFFAPHAKLEGEYNRLFASVFSNPQEMKRIVDILSERRGGYTRAQILEKMGKTTSGAFTKMLNALVASDFVESYIPYGGGKRNELFRLVDPFCLFYQHFLRGRKTLSPDFWSHNVTSQQLSSWRGFAFEETCFRHIAQIKRALGIAGVSSTQSQRSVKGEDGLDGTQIDMVIDRNDNVVDMCEMKFYSEDFAVDKKYHATLVHRQNVLIAHIPKRKTVHSVLVTTYGLRYNEYSGDFQDVVTLDDLFAL